VNRLEGKVALITGASRGIGRGIALCLAEEGADIVVNYHTHREEAEQVAGAIATMGHQALVCRANVAEREQVERMFEQTLSRFERIDIAVANAAFSIREPVIEAEWGNVLSVIRVAQFGVFHTCQLAAQQMVRQWHRGYRGGKVIIISSIMEEICQAESAAYNMSKGAISRLGLTMAGELAQYHVNVNVINPGWIDTPGERRYASEGELQRSSRLIPWGRMGTPEDIGRVAAFLASDDADYVTGATLRVDGGYVLGLRLPEPRNEN
jgi:glucose 1-dehydrogenase